jgi:hypothetical protein
MSWKSRRFIKRRRNTHHHNLAQCRGGKNSDQNVFILDSNHHEAYHKLFGTRTFAEAAEVLRRMEILHLRRFK